MCAIVDDAIHVQVKVVNNGYHRCPAWLIDERVPLTEPPVEFRDSCRIGDGE